MQADPVAAGRVAAPAPPRPSTARAFWLAARPRTLPLALRCLKSAFNADCDGQIGLQELAGNATLLYYMSEEAQEGRDAFVQKREPDFARFPRRP